MAGQDGPGSLALRGAMRTLFLLIALSLLGAVSPARALTSPPAQDPALRGDGTVVPEMAAHRRGVRSRSGARRMYRDRQYPRPAVIAPPMERIPPVAPLAPRIGN